jgi:hypothetical protein
VNYELSKVNHNDNSNERMNKSAQTKNDVTDLMILLNTYTYCFIFNLSNWVR